MKRFIASAVVLAGLVAFAAPASAEPCSRLNGRNVCVTFKYSSGYSNKFTTSFLAPNMSIGDSAGGTYTCVGNGFVEVNYLFSGIENQTWLAKVVKNPDGSFKLSGFGKSDGGYLYTLSGKIGTRCNTMAPDRLPGAAQNE